MFYFIRQSNGTVEMVFGSESSVKNLYAGCDLYCYRETKHPVFLFEEEEDVGKRLVMPYMLGNKG